jgi:hypothetical protein
MKFVEPRSYADPEVAARKLLDIVNSVEPVQDGRIHIEKINARMSAVAASMYSRSDHRAAVHTEGFQAD